MPQRSRRPRPRSTRPLHVCVDGINPRLTGTISLRYLQATRLGQLHAEATTTRVDGVKTFAVGHLADEDGVTVEADGMFIPPRWARDHSD